MVGVEFATGAELKSLIDVNFDSVPPIVSSDVVGSVVYRGVREEGKVVTLVDDLVADFLIVRNVNAAAVPQESESIGVMTKLSEELFVRYVQFRNEVDLDRVLVKVFRDPAEESCVQIEGSGAKELKVRDVDWVDGVGVVFTSVSLRRQDAVRVGRVEG